MLCGWRRGSPGLLDDALPSPASRPQCRPRSLPPPHSLRLQAEIIFRNPGGNYLSAGEQPLPLLFLAEALAFAAAFVVWFRYTRKHAAEMHKVRVRRVAGRVDAHVLLACALDTFAPPPPPRRPRCITS